MGYDFLLILTERIGGRDELPLMELPCLLRGGRPLVGDRLTLDGRDYRVQRIELVEERRSGRRWVLGIRVYARLRQARRGSTSRRGSRERR